MTDRFYVDTRAYAVGDVVRSRRHKGFIRLVVVYSNGGGVGKKIKKDGNLSRQEVCLGPGSIVAVKTYLPGLRPR